MKSPTREIEGLVRHLHASRDVLREARWRLAAAARDGAAEGLVEETWDWARKVLQARAPWLRSFPGVVGYGLGTRVRAGEPQDEPCLTAYVRRKLPAAELAARGWRTLPQKVGTGPRAIGVDVVALGDLERHAASAQPAAADLGLVPLPHPGSDWPREAKALVTRLAAGQRVSVAGLGTLRGWRPAVFPADAGESVALAGAVSGRQIGALVNPLVHLPAWGLGTALLAQVHSIPGDSGAPLVDVDGVLLGFLVGRATCPDNPVRVFRPAGFFARAASPI